VELATRHGQNRHRKPSPEYVAWLAAKKRCGNPRSGSYRHYGGRGIRMWPEWARSFEAFLRDVGCKPDPTYSLDRIDPDGHYEPGNCRWAPPLVQARNKRNVRWYDFRGERLVLAEVALRLGTTRDRARALERSGALPAGRIAERPAQTTIIAPVGYVLDLNDVAPLAWLLADAAGEGPVAASFSATPHD